MHLRRRIELYLRKNRMMTPTRLGREAMGDPRFVFDLRNGRELGENTVARVARWLDSRDARR